MGAPIRATRLVALCLACLWLAAATACATNRPDPLTLRVLASTELADMAPLLDELRRETGITPSAYKERFGPGAD